MNTLHRWACRSAGWRKLLEQKVVPWVLDGLDLGDHLLEVGPGPGLTTSILRNRVPRLTAIEVDERLASSLKARLGGGNTEIVQGDGTKIDFGDRLFSSAVCFTMLHHVPSEALQDKLLREVFRVLRPGGVFAGVDSIASPLLRLFHIHDTFVPVDPGTFAPRLAAAGFQDILVERAPERFRFRAARPKA